MIRKKLLQNSNLNFKKANDSPEVTRVSVLLLYLHNKIESELQLHKTRRGTTTGGPNGIKLLEISFDIKSTFEEEILNVSKKGNDDFLKDIIGEDKFDEIT